ncbi:MAG: hypothetical protein WCD08_11505 [Steroidobacteraceae bacterium]
MARTQADADRLEKLVHAALRKLPPLQAPATLEARVFGELARREALPWWRQGFGRWPLAARLLFVPLSAGCMKLAFLGIAAFGSMLNAAQQTSVVSSVQNRWQALSGAVQSLQSLGTLVVREVPQLWIYGAAGMALLLYVALFGIGAVAFRSLLLTPNLPGRTS